MQGGIWLTKSRRCLLNGNPNRCIWLEVHRLRRPKDFAIKCGINYGCHSLAPAKAVVASNTLFYVTSPFVTIMNTSSSEGSFSEKLRTPHLL